MMDLKLDELTREVERTLEVKAMPSGLCYAQAPSTSLNTGSGQCILP